MSAPRFVVQQHDATTRHFDVRLEVDGVLRSWAVPRGPSLDPADRRLAVPVPDHELAHGDFEGVLPDVRRGTGAVIVWDRGTYASATPLADALSAGHVTVELHGEKLRGAFALTRTGEDRWILVKVRDEHARRGSDVTHDLPASVLSGRTIEQVAASGD